MKKKSSKQAPQRLVLSDQDVSAILCALPLVSYYEETNPMQYRLNISLMESASKKLASRDRDLLPNEIRVIYAAIICAVNLDVNLPDANIDTDWRMELQGHFFTLNKLLNQFKDHFASV